MSVQTLQLAGRKYALLPYSEYEKLWQKTKHQSAKTRAAKSPRLTAEDRADIAAAKRSLADKGDNIPWEQVKKELGL